MKKEIEVKASVSGLSALAKKLEALGCTLSDPAEQDDTIFINFEGEYTNYKKAGTNFLRIRRTKGKALFTIKQPQSNELDRIEHETEIADPEQMEQAVLLMGYRKVMRYVKTRRKTKYGDCEICLDDVQGLGTFVEVEKITEDDPAAVQEEMFGFLETLGVSREARVEQGYDTLFYLKEK